MATGNGVLASHGIHTKLSWALRSEPGERRTVNDDFGGTFVPTIPDDAWDRGPLFVVTDGTDDHAAGDVASRIAAEAAVRDWSHRTACAPLPAIRAAVCASNAAVYDRAQARDRCGIGSRIVALTLSDREAIVGNVGDCRAYLVRADECRELTADVPKSVGTEASVDFEVSRHSVQQSDVIVLCTDGLSNVVAGDEMVDALATACDREPRSPTALANVLVDLALQRAAPDNVTTLVVEVTSVLPIPPTRTRDA